MCGMALTLEVAMKNDNRSRSQKKEELVKELMYQFVCQSPDILEILEKRIKEAEITVERVKE